MPLMTSETQHEANKADRIADSLIEIDNTQNLSAKETRQFVTPYAFEVSPELFGTHLASPTRRLIAMLVDLLLVALLTQVSSLILAGIAAATFFRAGNRLKKKMRFNGVRIFLRLLTALLLFVIAVGIFEAVNDDSSSNFGGAESLISIGQGVNGDEALGIDGLTAIGLSSKYLMASLDVQNNIQTKKCSDAELCWQALGNELVDELIKLKAPKKTAFEFLEAFVDLSEASLTRSQSKALQQNLQTNFSEQTPNIKQELNISIPTPLNGLNAITEPKPVQNQAVQNQTPSLLAWAQGLLEDLGLGFGWAALYFSVFTAWWKGQTPGKRLTQIKVVKLDGKGLNLWESFGRYGGYGAGFATGLLGFMQVYWDPNRQAIQDKISETLVLDLSKTKIQLR